jgi:biopolymer transport protein TolQ
LPNCPIAPAGFSLWDLFIQADWIVKSVILGLAGASVWSWAIIFSKVARLKQLGQEAQEVSAAFSEGMLEKGDHHFSEHRPFVQLSVIASHEWKRIKAMTSIEQRQMALQRLEQLFTIHIDEQKEDLSMQMNVLASVGSTAPFVGLFGTVWGIMNSFQCIAMTKNTSLAVVAPGIAEALFATAIGLVVAIPAVIAYNRLSISIQNYGIKMENFAQKLLVACMRG